MKWTRKKFKEEFGEDPVDMLGQDWEAMLEDFDEILLGNNAEPIRNISEDDWRKDDR